jgi:hypothetical protein
VSPNGRSCEQSRSWQPLPARPGDIDRRVFTAKERAMIAAAVEILALSNWKLYLAIIFVAGSLGLPKRRVTNWHDNYARPRKIEPASFELFRATVDDATVDGADGITIFQRVEALLVTLIGRFDIGQGRN